jgi:hypothetical protein
MERIDFEPENLTSVETFVQTLVDNERTGFMPGEAQKLAIALHRSLPEIIKELKDYGLTVVVNQRQAQARGFNSNDHNLFASMNHHGGSGWEQVSGFAGQNG